MMKRLGRKRNEINRKTLAAAFLSSFLLLPCCRSGEKYSGIENVAQNDSIPVLGFWEEDFSKIEGKLSNGETLNGLFCRLGMNSVDAHKLSQSCAEIFDVRKLRSGNSFEAFYSGDSLAAKLEYLVYSNDKVRSTIFKCSDSLHAWVYEKPVTLEHRCMDVIIKESLWNDLSSAGISPLLIMDLSEIFAWTVNFFALQKGDRFRAIYDQKVCEGEVIEITQVEFSIYDNLASHVCAIRLDQGDGGNKYWNEKGESMRKAFLKAPLKYNRISSRFTYSRKHPVTGKVRPHTAVDYAAPVGTPVHSIGDGKVTVCGWDPNGGGNRIRIRHMNGYETAYLHLSKFAKGLKTGMSVVQGQTIGYVGSTGLSTGPHLDFRVWKDGTPVNPLKMISPPSEPIRKENLDSLMKLKDKYLQELEGI